jgi:hypothetical protein
LTLLANGRIPTVDLSRDRNGRPHKQSGHDANEKTELVTRMGDHPYALAFA